MNNNLYKFLNGPAYKLIGDPQVKRAILELTGSGGGGSISEANLAAFPAIGTADIIYVAEDTNYLYRWTGSAYTQIGGGNIPSNYIFLSKAGIPDNADIVNGTTFGTDGTAAIQAILNTASASNPLFIFWDTHTSHTGLRIKGYTTIHFLPGCGFILRNGSNKPVIQNYNSSMTTITDERIYITGPGIINGNGYKLSGDLSAAQSYSTLARGYNVGISFNGVRHFAVRDVEIKNCITYCGIAVRCEDGEVKNCKIWDGGVKHTYQDGFDFFSSKRINIESNYFDTGDDHICLGSDVLSNYSDPSFFGSYYAGGSGDIEDIRIVNNYFTGNTGIRGLSTANRFKNIYVANNSGVTDNYWFIADNYYYGLGNAEVDGPGYFENVLIENNHIEVVDTYAPFSDHGLGHINIAGNWDGLTIRNNRRTNFTDDTRPTIVFQGPSSLRKNVTIEGYDAVDTTTNEINHIDVVEGIIPVLTIMKPSVQRTGADNDSVLVHIGASATVDTIENVGGNVKGVNNVVNNEGSLTNIQSVGLRHVLTTDTNATFKSSTAVADIVLSNYFGYLPVDGTFTKQRGDAFASDGLPTYVPGLSGSAVNLTFSGSGNLVTEHPSEPHTWIPGSSASVGYGNIDIANLTLLANTSGRIICSTPGSTAFGAFYMLSESSSAHGNVDTGKVFVGFAIDQTGLIYKDVNGVSTSTGQNITNGHYLSIYRDGASGTLKLEDSPDGTTWSTLVTFSLTGTAHMYVITDIYLQTGIIFGRLISPQAIGLV